MKLPPIVVVEWEDIATTHGWRYKVADCTTARCISTGFLTHQSARYVHVTQNISEDRTYDETTVIPRGVIKRITRLRSKRTWRL